MKFPIYNNIVSTENKSVFQFTSIGKKEIIKIVEFELIDFDNNIYNLAFGDKTQSGFSDEKNSNNGDIIKVIATVIFIYTSTYPDRIISIFGSNSIRILTYERIIRNYYKEFSQSFEIWGLDTHFNKEKFNPEKHYEGFLIKRI